MSKTSSQNRHIGFFQFYDDNKGFGFLGTNRVLFDEDNDNNKALIGVYVNSSTVNSKESVNAKIYPPFSEDDWLTFETKKTHKSYKAIHLQPAITCEGLLIAIKHYWVCPVIEGYDKKCKNFYKKNVIFEILKRFLYTDNDSKVRFIEILCSCLVDISDKEKFISVFLEENIYPLLKDSVFNFSIESGFDNLTYFNLIIDKIVENLIEESKWSDISEFWVKGFVHENYYPILCKKIMMNIEKM